MASVWKRLQRVNKRAAKFQYTASYHRIDLDTTPKWKPNKLSIVWTRRSRRVVTDPLEWEPSLKDPLKGSVIFTLPENKTVAVTLFKDSRTNELEDKEWTFVLEDVSPTGRRRRLAQAAVNLRAHASLSPARRTLLLTLEPCSGKVARAAVSFTLHCVLLREGRATDEDMQSLASLLSVNNNSDVAVLEDLDEDDYTLSDHSTRQMSDFRQQMEEMTQSLSSEIAATPNSVQSLNFDTPTAPQPPESLKINLNDPKYNPAPKLPSPIDNLKTVVFKPKTVMKRNLKPLDLKCNLNDFGLDRNDNEDVDKTPTGGDSGFNADKEKTPVVDLLEWCQSVTSEYKSCPVTDLTTSFKSGLAFCAIIHRFRPDLIDFSGLQPDDCAGNVRCALAASAALGIPPVLAHTDVSQPDRLAVMTYLFQLRAHFTGNELQVEQLGNDETESSYLVGRHDTDAALPPELFSREVALRRSQRAGRTSVEPTPTSGVNVRQLLLSHSNNILNKCRAVTENKHHNVEPLPARPEILMTRKELTDPFASDEEDEVRTPTNDVQDTHETEKQEPQKPTTEPVLSDPLNVNSLQIEEKTEPKPEVIQTIIENQSPLDILHINNDNLNASDVTKNDFFPSLDDFLKTKEEKVQSPELPKPTPQLLSRHDELKERARQLLEATKKEAREKDRRQKEKEDGKIENVNGVREPTSPKKVMTEEERQTMLRERARKLIADARAGIVSPSSPLSPGRRAGAVEIISKQTVMDEIGPAGGVDQLDLLLSRADSTHSSPSRKTTPSPDRSDPDSADCKSVRSLPERVGELSISAMVERLTPDKEGFEPDEESGSYIQSELEALEREQTAVDERAAMLEKQLRRVMQARDAQEEDKLMSQWFNLVNKKNALLRRQMQLNILEQEEDLSRRCALLARELRLSLAVEEWRKTPGQRRRERLLLQDLIAAVNERDRLVQEMDEQEKAIADDDEIQRNLSQVEIQRKNNCILQ